MPLIDESRLKAKKGHRSTWELLLFFAYTSSYSSLLDSGKNTHGFLLTIRGDGGGGEAGAACEALAALEAVHGAQEAEGGHEVVAARDADWRLVHEAVVGGGDLEVEEGCAYLVICLISYGLLPS
ncbi:hypothetical protein SAY87_022928 [Trapa incisa]|uniref:Uncharacterized protein n=1 Tax=Trapa incisa TaxID=236973 RepID=A0AAN7Q596_9MYRT|nr:hypothetical protein SAY87_022928 [Trapa incisa]